MNEVVAETMAQYLEHTSRSRHWSGNRFVFRGVSDARYLLVPGVGRTPHPPRLAKYKTLGASARTAVEREALEMFASRCVAFLDQRPTHLLECMFHAQHHGLPTRLLDWTFSPLVALYFVVTDTSTEVDGAVHVYLPRQDEVLAEAAERSAVENDPLGIQRDYLVVPPYVNRRLAAQQGCFTLHADPMAPLQRSYLYPVRIPASAKLSLWRQLDHMGIGPGAMFPDLDGLARSVKYFHFGPFLPRAAPDNPPVAPAPTDGMSTPDQAS